MDKKKLTTAAEELNDDLLDQVNGGVINVFDAPSPKQPYYKYTCHACGKIGIGPGDTSECAFCKSTNISCEEYTPVAPY